MPKHRYAAGLSSSKSAIPFVLTQGDKIVRLRLVARQDAFQKRNRGLAVWVGAVGAIVFLEGFLRKAVESERGDGAFETRGGDTAEPGARNKDSFICVVAIANTGSSKMVSDWSSSQAPTYSRRISAKE